MSSTATESHTTRISRRLLEDRHLILVSNRGPYEFAVHDGGYARNRGAGGVVTAMSSVSKVANPTWIAAARTDADRRLQEEHKGAPIPVDEPGGRYMLRFIDLPSDVYDGYYNVIANPLLWFLQHYMWDTPREPQIGVEEWRAWVEGYVPANEGFARVVSQEVRRRRKDAVLMLQDYHL